MTKFEAQELHLEYARQGWKEVTSDSQQVDSQQVDSHQKDIQQEDSLEVEVVDNQQVAHMQEEDSQQWVDKPGQGVTCAEQLALP